MFERVKELVLRLLRVPGEPEPPFGDPASLQVFRASRKLYWLRLARWGLGQAVALAGIIFWIAVIGLSEHEAGRMRTQPADAGALRKLPPGRNQVTLRPLRHVPPAVFGWLWVAKGFGLLLYLGQLGITYAAVRLEYELRWYIVTDRSLRIRCGLWRVQEMTMSFANLQQVMVSQGPLERLLGIANVQVTSAGGAGGGHQEEAHAESMHTGLFRGVENAEQIRELILARLRSFHASGSGLGDPDEKAARGRPVTGAGMAAGDAEEMLAAGRELLAEARALRAAVVGK